MKAFAVRDYFWLPPLPAWINAYALRAWISALLALYIAFVLQLDNPIWAWLTAWIVSQPTPGMVLSHGFYRVIGTIGGALFAIVIVALFAQAPELFLLALLVGGCTVLSNILTNNRAYATVLTGYTAAIVASDAFSNPNQILYLATSRGAAILLGVGCTFVVNLALHRAKPSRAEYGIRAKLAQLLKQAAHRAATPWQRPLAEKIKIGNSLINDGIALNTLIEYAAAESGIFRLQANNARSVLAHLFGLISARRALDFQLRQHGWAAHEALQIYHGTFLDLLNDLAARLDDGELDQHLAEIAAVLATTRPFLKRARNSSTRSSIAARASVRWLSAVSLMT